ncbi:ankyrin repeat domain-containing protein 9-like [Anomaloglossus baeobatrachus]|uniref:ankyrin repeat domain-containing protein 9-like n=1 Tax=Anomaloglossus baeobatrachus TaxID=238106 RepID=UPI003F4FCAE4
MDITEPNPCHASERFSWRIKCKDPVWKLEKLRVQILFEWEEEFEDQFYSPSSTLFYSVIPYARYLLIRFAEDCLKVSGLKGDQFPSYAFHLGLAVTYNRPEILTLIMETCQQLPLLHSYINLENYFFINEGKTPLHRACEHLKNDLVLILLRYGAEPRLDDNGQTPMDDILTQIWSSRDNMELKMQCLDFLLLFTPPESLQMKEALRENGEYWETVLGEDIYAYLLGEQPAPLALMSMKKALMQLPPSKLMKSIESLPIPHSLKNRFTLGY